MRVYKKYKHNDLSELLWQYRKDNNIKTSDFAKAIGMNMAYYGCIEGGKKPHLHRLLRIAEKIDMSQETLNKILLKYYKKQLRSYIKRNIDVKKISDAKLLEIYQFLADAEPIKEEEQVNE